MTKIKIFNDEKDNSHKYVHLHFLFIIYLRFTKFPLRISILQWAIKDHGLQ